MTSLAQDVADNPVDWNLCKRKFGVTDDVNKASWLLPDGSMLNFHRDKGFYEGYLDHFSIRRCLPSKFRRGKYWPIFRFAEASGAVRITASGMPGSRRDEFEFELTANVQHSNSQMRMLRDYCEASRDCVFDIYPGRDYGESSCQSGSFTRASMRWSDFNRHLERCKISK